MPDTSTFVFVGPTLEAAKAREILPAAVYLPPAAQGDVYRAACRKPAAIGIIDGVFDLVPSVWHKEILFALAEGIRVFGAASMGALRAAELDAFGMVGVGHIYGAYRDGTLDDDDEVAVAHATADDGFKELSEAMVNIRATIRSAETAGIIGAATGALVEQTAKGLFYPDRTFAAAIAEAIERGGDRQELEDFRGWLPSGRINLKRSDAIEMLGRMREGREGERPRFHFEHTVFFADLAAAAGWEGSAASALAPRDSGVLDEVRLRPGLWHQTIAGAALRELAERDARTRNLAVSNEALVDTTLAFRRERDLHDSPELLAWLERHELDGKGFIELMENETRLKWLLRACEDGALEQVPHELRANGTLGALRARAREKERWLDGQGLSSASLRELGLREADIFEWYFVGTLGRCVPADLWAYSRSAGFADVEQFRRAVAREYLFATRDSQAATELMERGDGDA